MFLVNSRPGRFSAASLDSSSKWICRLRHSLSRSYGVNLPSSLTRVISSTLGFSPRLPVSVYGTVVPAIHIEVFLGSMIRASLCAKRSLSNLGVSNRPDLPGRSSYLLGPAFPSAGWPFTSASPRSSSTAKNSSGIFTGFPSPTPFDLSLGADLP